MPDINHFLEFSKVNVNDKTEEKNGLTYLSWAFAVDALLRHDPMATWDYREPSKWGETVMVYCTVTAFGKAMTAQLPVMDHRNKAIINPDSFQVNVAMQRALAKAIALHGLGLYIYAGEDLPLDDDGNPLEGDSDAPRPEKAAKAPKDWRNLPWHLPFGKAQKGSYAYKGQTLGEINANDPDGFAYWVKTYEAAPYKGKINEKDATLRLALNMAREELTYASESTQERSRQDNEEKVPQMPKLGRQELLTALAALSDENGVSFAFILGLLKKKSVILAEVSNIEACTTEVLQQVHDNFKWFVGQKQKQETK